MSDAGGTAVGTIGNVDRAGATTIERTRAAEATPDCAAALAINRFEPADLPTVLIDAENRENLGLGVGRGTSVSRYGSTATPSTCSRTRFTR